MKLTKDIFYAGVSLGIDTMRKNLQEPLKSIEQGVIAACNDIGLNPEHEINGIPFVGRVMIRVMESQLGEKLMPENEAECSHLVLCSKLAAYADQFGMDKAAAEYNLSIKEVQAVCEAVWGFRDNVASIGWDEHPQTH